MEARYAARKSPLLNECQVAPEIFEQVMPRLEAFMKPFVRIFQGQAATHHANTSVYGLLSNVERKNIASIADRFGQSRLPLQDFIGVDAWDDAPLREELQGHIRRHVGQGDGVLVFDPSGFPTSGRESVGVARQWCGRPGEIRSEDDLALPWQLAEECGQRCDDGVEGQACILTGGKVGKVLEDTVLIRRTETRKGRLILGSNGGNPYRRPPREYGAMAIV